MTDNLMTDNVPNPVTRDYVEETYMTEINKGYNFLLGVTEVEKPDIKDIPRLTKYAIKVVEKLKTIHKLKRPLKGQVKRQMAIILVEKYLEEHHLDSDDPDDLTSQIVRVGIATLPILIDTLVDAITGNFSIGRTVGRCATLCGYKAKREPRFI